MKRRRHIPGHIIRKLREADRLLAEGARWPEVAKALEVSDCRSSGRCSSRGWRDIAMTPKSVAEIERLRRGERSAEEAEPMVEREVQVAA